MEYQQLSQTQQVQSLTDRQAQLEAEHFSNMTALAEAQAKGFADDSEEVQTLARNIEIIEQAHAEVTTQLSGAPTKPAGNDSVLDVNVPVVEEVQPVSEEA